MQRWVAKKMAADAAGAWPFIWRRAPEGRGSAGKGRSSQGNLPFLRARHRAIASLLRIGVVERTGLELYGSGGFATSSMSPPLVPLCCSAGFSSSPARSPAAPHSTVRVALPLARLSNATQKISTPPKSPHSPPHTDARTKNVSAFPMASVLSYPCKSNTQHRPDMRVRVV